MALVIDAEADDLALSNDDPVSSWPGGGGNDFTAGVGEEPIYKTNIVNSLPAVLFDGATEWMTNAYSPTGDLTAYIVAKLETNPASLGMLCSCHNPDVGDGTDGGFWFGFYTAGSSLGMNSGIGGTWVSGVNVLSGVTTGFDTNWHLWTIRITTNSSKVWCDNLLAINDGAGTIATGHPLHLSDDSNAGGSYMHGYIAKVAWYDTAHDDAAREAEWASINAKYSLWAAGGSGSSRLVGGQKNKLVLTGV